MTGHHGSRSPSGGAEGARPILIVDDDPKIVRLVAMYLEREGLAVVEASDGATALALFTQHDPQLVVLDVMLPALDGLAVLGAIRQRGDTPVIVLSAKGATADRISGLAGGADDYVPKPFSPSELVLRVKRVLARTSARRPAEREVRIRLHDLVVDRARHLVSIAGDPVALTALEFRLLAALLEADGRVLSREQLLDAVYGADDEGVLDRTIDVHVRRLREKLRDSVDEPRYVVTVRGVGYRAESTPVREVTAVAMP
jgi:DNA-binding response OmpR family regulator